MVGIFGCSFFGQAIVVFSEFPPSTSRENKWRKVRAREPRFGIVSVPASSQRESDFHGKKDDGRHEILKKQDEEKGTGFAQPTKVSSYKNLTASRLNDTQFSCF